MEGTMSVADLDDIENMVADRGINDDEVEHLLSERLLDGFLLMERSCPSCTTPLVKQPMNDAGSQPWTPKESKKAISIIQKIQSQESPMSCTTTPRQAPAPVPGVPFCVNCKAHVVTHESEIQHLDSEHKTMRHQGKILVDLSPPMSPEANLDDNMYETTTITSASTQFQLAALREQNNKSCSPMSTRTARTTSSGLLALAASSMIPTPTHANTKTHVKSTVMPPKQNEAKSIIPAPDDDDEKEDEIEVSITAAPMPISMSMIPQVLSPANSTFLPVAISEDEAPQEQEQQHQQQHGGGGGAIAQEEKKVVDDHEDDSLIEIDDDDDDDDETTDNDEAYEIIHLSDDTDVVEGGPRLQRATRPSLTGEDTNMASIHAAEIVMVLSNLEAESQAVPASTANTNVQPSTPKLVIEKTMAEQIPHASPEKRTSATTNTNETAGEGDNDLLEYSVR
jgi:hypothetical protein